MAFTGAVAATLYRSAVAVLVAAHHAYTEAQLAHDLIRINGRAAGQSFAAYQAIARQAIRGVQAGAAVQQAGGQIVPAANLPIRPGINPGDPRYEYRLLIVVTDPQTGQEVRYATDIQSDSPVSLQTLVSEAQENFQTWTSRRSTGRAIAQLGGNVVVSAEVLSAGKRS